ncbi:hypothetical protein JL49_20930 [Pseudoalteromonas luteoviolacea]|nr:hypothetical protein JL49_20930 [Pseudoalteromonas luteoviolacea]
MTSISILIFLISMLAVSFLSAASNYLGLIDTPCSRKAHKGKIPLVGGIAVFTGSSVGIMLTFEYSLFSSLFIIASSLMVFIGVLDDKYNLSVRSRLIGQFLVSSILVFGLNTYLSSLGNIIFGIDVELAQFGIIFTYLAIIGAINAFNMVDGIDGLLGGVGCNALLGVAVLCYLAGNEYLFKYALIIIVAMLPYLLANLRIWPFSQKKIFMGDAGSMFIGLVVVWLIVFGTQDTFLGEKSFNPVTALYLVALPLMDMVAIMFRRIKKKQSPFKPDRNHIHHIFMRAGLSDRQALVILCLLSLTIMLVGITIELIGFSEWLSLLIFLGIFMIFNLMINHAWVVVKFIRKFSSKGEI